MLGVRNSNEQIKDSTGEALAQEQSLRRPKIGLALGAGVARGWAHIGVIRRLLAEGIKPDVIAGTSIGAVVGGGLACGNLDAIEDWARGLGKTNMFRFLNIKLGGSGLFGSEKLNAQMTERFGTHNFADLHIPFTAVACELKTGHEVWLKEGPVSEAIRASFALPGIFEPRLIDNQWLVDGALVNPVPVSVCRAAGCDLVIAVNLSEDIYGRARARREGALDTGEYGVFSENTAPPAMQGGNRSILRRFFGHKDNAPSMFANLVASVHIMQNRLSRSRLAGDPPDVTITPRCGHVGLMEFHRASELIDEGERAFELSKFQLRDAMAIVNHRMNV
jgi:NTE family protein